MIDKSAIETLQRGHSIKAAEDVISVSADPDNLIPGVAALTNDFTVHDLEKYLPVRRRLRGRMETPAAGSFADYVRATAEAGATVFVDPKTLTATAVLNLGTPEAPGHADNLAHFAPPRLAAFAALLATASGKTITQQAAAEWMEDWQDIIKCVDADGTEIPTHKAIAAVRRITIEAMRKQESEAQQLRQTTSTFEDIQAKSVEPLPARISVACVPLVGLPERTFHVRLGIMTGDKTPGIVLRIVKLEEHFEKMADDLATLIDQKLAQFQAEDAPLPAGIVMGTYQRS